jgi:hypothetical protein
MDSAVLINAAATAVLEVVLAVLAVVFLGARVHSARTVMKRLEARGGRWSVETGRLTRTWNPAGAGIQSRLSGRARATYWIDDSGLVQLLFEPVDGPSRRLVGPRPIFPPRSQTWAAAALSIAVAALALGTGGTAGYLASAPADRFNGLMFGALVGLSVAWFDWPVIAGLTFRRTRDVHSS